jgi:hypothetical protein
VVAAEGVIVRGRKFCIQLQGGETRTWHHSDFLWRPLVSAGPYSDDTEGTVYLVWAAVGRQDCVCWKLRFCATREENMSTVCPVAGMKAVIAPDTVAGRTFSPAYECKISMFCNTKRSRDASDIANQA